MDKDRFDALMQLANFRREIRQSRVTTYWYVTLGIWAAIAATATALHGISYLILIPAGLLLVGVHIYWIYWNYIASERTAAWMYYFYESAEHAISPKEFRQPELPVEISPLHANANPGRFYFLEHPPSYFAVIVTVVLVGIAIC